MSFIRTYATKSLFSPHNMVCIHMSKLHSEKHDLEIIISVKKLTTLSQFNTEIVDFYWVQIRSLNLWSTMNQYCVISAVIVRYFRQYDTFRTV